MTRRLRAAAVLVRFLAACALVLRLPPSAGASERTKLLPEGSLRMMGARYAPAERDFQWDTWIGGEIGLVRFEGTTLLADAEVETILGNELRAFDANQANYHLTGALKRPWGALTAELFFSHVSRHAQDRAKPQTVDWNILGLRLSGPLTRTRPSPIRFRLSAGPTTRSSLVQYRFEVVARVEADAVEKPWGGLYLSLMVRGVRTEPTDVRPRRGFVDANVEGGARIRRGQRSFQIFAAYEHRNDVYPLVPVHRDRALLGLRFGIADRSP